MNDDMLSKEEIDALLGVVDGKTFGDDENISEDINSDESTINEVAKTDEEGNKDEDVENNIINNGVTGTLTHEEKDILGEVGNISMGTSATTLYTLLDEKVSITTPYVEVCTWKSIADSFEKPCVGIRVDYKVGLRGTNALLLKEQDVKTIASIMMQKPNGREISVEDEPLTEIDLSAIVEAMNQMVGSSATSLSSMLNMKIDIETPVAKSINVENNEFDDDLGFNRNEEVVMISFRMVVGDILDSSIMQVIPMEFAKEMVSILSNGTSTVGESIMENTNIESESVVEIEKAMNSVSSENKNNVTQNIVNNNEETISNKEILDEVQKHATLPQQQNINVSNAQFQNFSTQEIHGHKENIGIIMDVPLEVSVELGRTKKKIKDILEFSPGTIIELDKIAGDPIDVMVNGKFVAKGEVVVIDENFGIRITDIVSVENRI